MNTPLLEMIDLSNNLLKELPDNFSEHFSSHHFRLLDVSNNQLESLPDNLIALFEDRKLMIHVFRSKVNSARGGLVRDAANPNWGGEERVESSLVL